MTHLLDSNTCINFLRRGGSTRIAERLTSARPGSIVLCSVVVAELIYGAYRSNQSQKTLANVRSFCAQFISLPFDDRAAEKYSTIRAHLTALGLPIGPNDLLIAAIATSHGLTLVTHDTAEFSRVPGLSLEDWQIS